MEKQAFKRIPVESSNIKFIGHSYPRRMLEVGFNNGSVYRYKGVPNKVYKELLNAESKGKAFHYLIRSKYPYKQTIDKNGDKVNGGYKKMAMRNFDEFIKTAGIFQTYADALTGRNVDKAQKRYARTVNNFDKAKQISERMERNRAGARLNLSNAEVNRDANRRAIQESLDKTKEWSDMVNSKKPGNRSVFDMVYDSYKDMKNNGKEVVNRAKRSKLNFNDKKLSNAVDEAKSTFQTAANKAGKASSLVDKKYNDVLKAQGGIKRAKVGSIAAKGATVAGLAGAAMIGKKLYNKYKNGDFKRQENTQPQYQTHTIQPQPPPQYQVNPYQQY